MNQGQLIGTAKKLDKILKIVQWVNCIAVAFVVCGMLILSIAYWVNTTSVNVADRITVRLGEVTLELANAGNAGAGIDLSYVWSNCVFMVLLLIILCIGFHYVRKIMVPMMEGNPFDISVSENLKKLSLISLGYGIVGNISSAIMTYMKIQQYDLMGLKDTNRIVSVTAEYRLELDFLIVFFVFLLASYIFRYGAELQRLSDETL